MLFMGSTILSDGSIAYAIDSSNSSIVEEVKLNEQGTVSAENENATLIEEVETIDENSPPTGEVITSKDNLIVGEENTNPVTVEDTSKSVQTFSTQSIQNPSVQYTT